jgi:hypothetical protein
MTIPNHTYLGSTEDDDRPARFEDRLALTSCLLDGSNDTQSPLKRGSHILVDVREIVAHYSNLVAVTSKKGDKLLVIHTTVDSSFADLEAIYVNDRQNSSRFLRIDVLCSMPGTANGKLTCALIPRRESTHAAVGPVSASPSPIITGTINSGLSMTAPKATARAYPSSPPSCIDPGTSALM